MPLADILNGIDDQIARLTQARMLLSQNDSSTLRAKPGPKPKLKKARNLSEDGRRRIAEAMRRRWANARQVAGTKTAGKTTSAVNRPAK